MSGSPGDLRRFGFGPITPPDEVRRQLDNPVMRALKLHDRGAGIVKYLRDEETFAELVRAVERLDAESLRACVLSEVAGFKRRQLCEDNGRVITPAFNRYWNDRRELLLEKEPSPKASDLRDVRS
jgi:hypothetical protein